MIDCRITNKYGIEKYESESNSEVKQGSGLEDEGC
jgi:hypothetical protein